MTQPVSNADAAEFAEIIQRLFALRSRMQYVLPEEIRQARARLEAAHPDDKSSRSADYALLHQVACILTAGTEPISMGELSRSLDIPLSSTTRIVDWLEQSGYVERQPDPIDRRVVRVGLTGEGRAIYQAAEAMARRRLEGWLERFSQDERQALIALLNKLAEIIRDEIGAG